MEVKFISNQNSNHVKELISLFSNADEIWIATAFLKVSGLKKVISQIQKHLIAKRPITIIAGQNFALTEPIALNILYNSFKGHPNARLFLALADKGSKIFHSKLYISKFKEKYAIISGSANLTGGGLETNIESSFSYSGSNNESAIKETLKFYSLITSPEYAINADMVAIENYTTFYNKQKNHNKNSKAIPKRNKSKQGTNYFGLLPHFEKFNNEYREDNYRMRLKQYKLAKKILNDIADNNTLTKKIFAEKLDSLVGSLDKNHLWHSGSLYRLRRKIYPYYKEFQNLVRYIKLSANQSTQIVFKKAKELVSHIYGADTNYVTEIMMTYNPYLFANINNNPLRVLKTVSDLSIKSTPAYYNGEDYKKYCIILEDIKEKFGLRDMLEVDSFFNSVYQSKFKNK